MTDPILQQNSAPAPAGVQLPPGMSVVPISDGEILAEINTFFQSKAEERRPYEMDWFLNAAAVRMAADARFHPLSHELEPLTGKAPSHRRYVRINRTRVKYLAKLAKYTNNRPRPVVLAASEDREDILDAKLTEQALKYIWRKIDLEAKYEQVTANAELTGKSFWAFRWNADARALVRDPKSGKSVEVGAGDVEVDVVSAFEMLVDDSGLTTLAAQPRIMRVRLELATDVERRYKLPPGSIKGDAGSEDLFQFQKQITSLGAQYNTSSTVFARSTSNSKDRKSEYVIVKEFFKKPNGEFPQGFYAVAAGGRVLRKVPRLPYGFNTFSNPYPFEEFASSISPEQFWPPTMVEQLRPVQENLNTFRSKLVEHLILNMHGKLLYPRRSGIPDTAWNSEPGEKIPFNWVPGMPLPFVATPPPLSPDSWRLLDMNIREFDEISNISASSLGMGTDAESGYQSVVLQEANDMVFGPDRNRMQRALAASLGKIRRLMAQGYTEERLVSAMGRTYAGSVFVFSQSNIDEAAEIQVQIGSALPDGKAARLDVLMNLKGSGLFGDTENPRLRRSLLELVDLGGVEQEVDPDYQDANRARLENLSFQRGLPVKPPLPWHKDEIHVPYHEEQLNSPEFDTWPAERQLALIEHYLWHLRRLDPMKGLDVAMIYANQSPVVAQLLPMFQQLVQNMQMQMQQQQGGPPQEPGAPGGQPPQGAPFSAPAQPSLPFAA
jgi:hypothetical protein